MSGLRRYLQLAESCREENERVGQRTIESPGRPEKMDAILDSAMFRVPKPEL